MSSPTSPPASASSATSGASTDGSRKAADGRAGLLWWLARRGLFAPRMRGHTGVAVALIALSVTVVAVPLALERASHEARQAELRKRPLCVWAGSRVVENQVSPPRLARLRQELQERLGEDAGRVREFPFYEMEYSWLHEDRHGEEVARPCSGRTIAADDPLWPKVTILHGRALREEDEGVAVTQTMLDVLQGEGKKPPAALRLRSPTTGKARSVPLLCVVAGSQFESGHDFALTERFERKLLTEDPDYPCRTIWTGPVGKGWWQVNELPEPVRARLAEAFATLQVGWPPLPEKRGGRLVWSLDAALAIDPPPTVSAWAQALRSLREVLRRNGLEVEDGFAEVDAPDAQLPPPARPAYHRLTVAVDAPELLEAVRDAAHAAGLPTHEVVIRQMKDVERAGQVWRWVNAGICAGMSVVAVILLSVVLGRQVGEQRRQVGMLKAMGAGGRLVLGVHLVEGLLLWLLGLLLGSVLAAAGALLLARALGWGEVAWATLAWPWWLAAVVVAGSALVCLLSTLVAVLRVAVSQPIRLIREEK